MKITHVAMWTNNLERLKKFYLKFFDGVSNEKYQNEKKGFASYFISFDNDVKLEIMSKVDISEEEKSGDKQYLGIVHLAFSVGSKKNVDELTKLLKDEGYIVLDEPRTTGDGFYESVILDPDKNRIEITIWLQTKIIEVLKKHFFNIQMILSAAFLFKENMLRKRLNLKKLMQNFNIFIIVLRRERKKDFGASAERGIVL